MAHEPRRIPQVSELQGLWIGILVVIVFAVSLIDWMFGVTPVPVNPLAAFSAFAILALISGVLLILSFKELSLDGFMGRSELVTTGVYAHIRHPHYLSNVLLSFSVATLFRSWTGLFTALCSVPVTYLLTLSEERQLERRFGKSHTEYASKVPMFILRIRK